MGSTEKKLAGRYEIIRKLGGGGFAITFLAKDIMQPSQPNCVVKQLRPSKTHPRIIDFFHKEAAVLEKLGKHPQIPRLLAHFQEGNNLYIVQEFIQGHDLGQEIFLGKRLGEIYVRQLLQEVLEILSFLHENGVIHRDIKPQNLMRRQEDGRICLIDFGAVKEVGGLMVNTRGEIASSIVIGTPGYMASEQGLGKPCLASDLYALGMTAISALTGLQPSQLEENPQTGEVIWLQQTQVSQELGEIISKMVRRHFSLRYFCANDVLRELNLGPRTPVSLTPRKKLSVPIKLSRRKALLIFGFAGAGFLVTFGLNKFYLNKLKNSSSPNLKTFEFEVVTVNAQGDFTSRNFTQAKYFTENLGNGITLEMVKIPGGEFIMGSPTEEEGREATEGPQHQVIVKPFFMGKFAVTQAQYQEIMGNNPSRLKREKHPVDSVNWNNAIEFCQKLTKKTGRTYRLPSEAEWEYACRTRTSTPFHFGQTIITDLANYNGSSTYADAPKGVYRNQTTEVGIFPSNAFGLYDMHGNVWEWCEDTRHNNYIGAPTDSSAWVDNNNQNQRVLRGGSWSNDPTFCRSAYRGFNKPDLISSGTGFRVVCDVSSEEFG